MTRVRRPLMYRKMFRMLSRVVVKLGMKFPLRFLGMKKVISRPRRLLIVARWMRSLGTVPWLLISLVMGPGRVVLVLL